jgi:phosphotransferase system enzyme I (PtsP)
VPSVSKDGVEVVLQINAGLVVDLPHLAETGAAGVGLFRTELQFMIAERMPSASEQQALYATVFAEAGDRPVTFRTLDIGGDKILPYMQSVEEENPALGWRAIRIGLDRPGLLRAQVRALLKAAAGRPLKIMFPMVATCDEFERAKQIVEREKTHLATHNHPLPSDLKLGVMLEVPSLLFQLPEICASADFISLGTNDLMQFLFASDRENRRVSDRFDPLSAPMLRALQMVAEHANAAGCLATVCGEIGGRPLEAMALIGLGFRSLSMSPAAIGPVKAMLLETNVAEIGAMIREVLKNPGGGETLRPKLAHFAETHGIPV